MPVFGIIHGQIVIGIIDEILRKPLPPSASPDQSSNHRKTTKSMQTQQTPSPHPQLAAFFSTSQEGEPPASMQHLEPFERYPTHSLHLVDTKTRRSSGLPSHDDTLSSRLQLMVYHRLLSDLLSTSPPFDFATLWSKVNVQSEKPLSFGFMLQAGLFVPGNDASKCLCLNGLTNMWYDMVETLGVQGIDRTLELIYREQPKGIKSAKSSGRVKAKRFSRTMSREEQDLTSAVTASLKDVGIEIEENVDMRVMTESVSRLESQSDPCILTPLGYDGHDPALVWALQQSMLTYAKEVKKESEAGARLSSLCSS
jgi:exonuclease V